MPRQPVLTNYWEHRHVQVRTCTQARWRGRAAEGWYVSASCVARIGPFGALKDQPRHSNVDGGPEAGGGGRTPRSAGCTVAGIPGIPVACAASPTDHGARIGGSASGLPPPTAHGAAAGGQTNRAPQSDLEKDHDGTLRHAARTPRCCRSTNDARVDPQRNERQTDTLIVRVLTLHGRQGRAKSSSHLNAGRKKPTVVQKFRKCRQTFGTVSRGSRGRNRHKAGRPVVRPPRALVQRVLGGLAGPRLAATAVGGRAAAGRGRRPSRASELALFVVGLRWGPTAHHDRLRAHVARARRAHVFALALSSGGCLRLSAAATCGAARAAVAAVLVWGCAPAARPLYAAAAPGHLRPRQHLPAAPFRQHGRHEAGRGHGGAPVGKVRKWHRVCSVAGALQGGFGAARRNQPHAHG